MANRFNLITRYEWRVDHRPAANVHRRDVVSQSSVTADHTRESTLRRSIGFSNVPAVGTSATGISGIHQDHRHTFAPRFVFHKRSQLSKRPTVQGGTLAATSRDSRADAAQVFERNCAASAFRLGHQVLADAVIHILRNEN